MRIDKSTDHKYLIYTPDNLKEQSKLEKFPGLQTRGSVFFSPNKVNINFNLFQRLRAKFSIRMAPDLLKEIETPLALKKIPESFKYYTQPLPFQEIALRYMYTCEGGGLLLEPGMGKTKVILDFIALMGFKKSLIICPKPLRFVWEDELVVHRPDKTIYVIDSTALLDEHPGAMRADIVVVNYDKAVDLKDYLASLKPDFICADEALIKDPDTQRTEAITELGEGIPYKALMSGTLVNNSAFDIFAPVRFLAPALVGKSKWKFLNEYGVKVPIKKTDGSEVSVVVGMRKEHEIRDILKSVSIVMTKAEWLKLPPKKFITKIVQISDQQRDSYYRLARNYITQIGTKDVEVDNALAMLAKLTQISNGFIYLKGDEEFDALDSDYKPKKRSKAQRETFFFDDQPKVDETLRLLRNDLSGRRVVLWYNMDAERTLLEKNLTYANITYTVIAGGDPKISEKVREFNRSRSIQVLLVQAKTLNYGVTILGKGSPGILADEGNDFVVPPVLDGGVYTQLFYSLNFSLEVFLQQQDRIHRIGQEHDCEYYIILSNTPSEMKTKDALDNKMSIRGRILIDIIGSLHNLV